MTKEFNKYEMREFELQQKKRGQMVAKKKQEA